MNAASSLAPDELGCDVDILGQSLLFAEDNVDHSSITLDRKCTFHGMGMIAAITPGKQVSHGIPQQKTADLKLVQMTKTDIIDYRFSKHVNRCLEFLSVPYTSDVCDRKVEQFLAMIDMNPGDKICILSTLDYLCNLSSKHNMPTIITFDQPLFWKASEIVNAVTDDSPISDVILLLSTFHTLMNVLGAIGTLIDGSGLNEIMETVYRENAVVHIMNGKAVQRVFRGHLLVDQCLTSQIVAKLMEDEPGFQDHEEELERLYMLMETGEFDLD